jgi:hypothetical protein
MTTTCQNCGETIYWRGEQPRPLCPDCEDQAPAIMPQLMRDYETEALIEEFAADNRPRE